MLCELPIFLYLILNLTLTYIYNRVICELNETQRGLYAGVLEIGDNRHRSVRLEQERMSSPNDDENTDVY